MESPFLPTMDVFLKNDNPDTTEEFVDALAAKLSVIAA
jgi:hypothetical protein